MNRLRFTVAQLMAIVLFVGFGFAALRGAETGTQLIEAVAAAL